ncbi:MAG: hypothetical protein LBP72_07035, partial [Dysgonamonadaceae bacterium]|nr:hypothetical protein [Dysgonamonadaceae bacterium]
MHLFHAVLYRSSILYCIDDPDPNERLGVRSPCHPALDARFPEQRAADHQGIASQARNDRYKIRLIRVIRVPLLYLPEILITFAGKSTNMSDQRYMQRGVSAS